MKLEILLKAYVKYQSEDAFRELVVSTLDEVYSASFRIVHGAPYLAEEITMRVYLELARKAPGLGEDIVLASWLRERTCKMAVAILHAENRAVDRAALKREKNSLSIPTSVHPAPAGLAIRVCQGVFLSTARHRGFGLFSSAAWWPAWIRPWHAGGMAVCVLAIIVWWTIPFHRQHPIIRSQGVQLTPASFAQLASPPDGKPWTTGPMANTNAVISPSQKQK